MKCHGHNVTIISLAVYNQFHLLEQSLKSLDIISQHCEVISAKIISAKLFHCDIIFCCPLACRCVQHDHIWRPDKNIINNRLNRFIFIADELKKLNRIFNKIFFDVKDFFRGNSEYIQLSFWSLQHFYLVRMFSIFLIYSSLVFDMTFWYRKISRKAKCTWFLENTFIKIVSLDNLNWLLQIINKMVFHKPFYELGNIKWLGDELAWVDAKDSVIL